MQNDVYKSYDKIITWYDEHRSRELFEKPYLDLIIANIKSGGKILDLGCGMGQPIAQYFIERGYQLTGVDGSSEMIALAKTRFPNTNFIVDDMRKCHLKEKFDAIIAWNSFFHLPQEDQPKMFKIFEEHILPNGILMFTSGPSNCEIWSDNGGENLYHASLDPSEYKELLAAHNFQVIKHVVDDEECHGATVWVCANLIRS